MIASINSAAALVGLKVDVLVAVTQPAALAAQLATATVPIVFILVADPVASKLVKSLAHRQEILPDCRS